MVADVKGAQVAYVIVVGVVLAALAYGISRN